MCNEQIPVFFKSVVMFFLNDGNEMTSKTYSQLIHSDYTPVISGVNDDYMCVI